MIQDRDGDTVMDKHWIENQQSLYKVLLLLVTNNEKIQEESIEEVRSEKAKLSISSEENNLYINEVFVANNRTLRTSKFFKKEDDTSIWTCFFLSARNLHFFYFLTFISINGNLIMF